MTALPNKCYSGHHKATEKEDDQETRGKEIWRGRCGQRASGLAGGRWRRQHKIELDGDEWSVAYAPLGATRHKSSKSSLQCRMAGALPVSDDMEDYFGAWAKHCDQRVCKPICLSVCLLPFLKNTVRILRNFLYTLPVVVARFFSDISTICDVLPVLWMTPCFHIIKPNLIFFGHSMRSMAKLDVLPPKNAY